MKFSIHQLFLILSAGSYALAANPILGEGTVYTETFTDSNGVTFLSTYSNGTDTDGVAALSIALSITGYDGSWISTTDGSEGMWMAVGFNSKFMPGTNVVYCYIPYTGTGTDEFSCVDAQNSGYTGPVDFSDQSFISDVTTITNDILNTGTSTLEVSFTRPTAGNTDDVTISAGTMNVIWAYGPYADGAVEEHVDRGSATFTVDSAMTYALSVCLLAIFSIAQFF
jgi:hypothetical protein